MYCFNDGRRHGANFEYEAPNQASSSSVSDSGLADKKNLNDRVVLAMRITNFNARGKSIVYPVGEMSEE